MTRKGKDILQGDDSVKAGVDISTVTPDGEQTVGVQAVLSETQLRLVETLDKTQGNIDEAISRVKSSQVLTDKGRVDTASQIVSVLRSDIDKIDRTIQATEHQGFIEQLQAKKAALEAKLEEMNTYIQTHSRGETTSGSGASTHSHYGDAMKRERVGFKRKF